jgi:hypothetical protein
MGDDQGLAIAVDGHDNVLLTGFFGGVLGGSVDFGFGPLTSAGGRDIFIAKYGPTGAPIWVRSCGGTGDDWATSISVDRRDDSVVVVGQFQGSVNFGSAALSSAGGSDIFLAKYSASGSPSWSKRFGNTSNDKASGVVVDGNGRIALVGNFASNVDFGTGALVYHGSSDVFVAQFSDIGGCLWSKNFGASWGGDALNGVASDRNGNVVITGIIINSLDLGGGIMFGSGTQDVLIAKFSASGAYIWAHRYSAGIGCGVATDQVGNIIGGGYFMDSINFGGGLLTSGNLYTAYAVKLTP